jgi:hypothetical protein
MKGFEERTYSRWALPLDLYELCLHLAQSCGDYFNRHFRLGASATNDYKFEALVRLQAGAARVAGEVYALLLAGRCAWQHWRSL